MHLRLYRGPSEGAVGAGRLKSSRTGSGDLCGGLAPPGVVGTANGSAQRSVYDYVVDWPHSSQAPLVRDQQGLTEQTFVVSGSPVSWVLLLGAKQGGSGSSLMVLAAVLWVPEGGGAASRVELTSVVDWPPRCRGDRKWERSRTGQLDHGTCPQQCDI